MMIAKARLRDAEILMKSKRYDGSIYLCGYSIELALKSRICKTLNWTAYPPRGQFSGFESFKTHNLDILLSLSGMENKIKKNFLVEWSLITSWNPELRYKPIGSANKKDASDMIDPARTLLREL